MRVYLAARFSRLPELNRYREELAELGIEVTSRWLDGGHEWVGTPDEEIPPWEQARFAMEDLDDILAADLLVCFTEPSGEGPARGGRHVEMGFALALGKPILVVGHYENVFYCLPSIMFMETWDAALAWLQIAQQTWLPVPVWDRHERDQFRVVQPQWRAPRHIEPVTP